MCLVDCHTTNLKLTHFVLGLKVSSDYELSGVSEAQGSKSTHSVHLGQRSKSFARGSQPEVLKACDEHCSSSMAIVFPGFVVSSHILNHMLKIK